MSSVSISPFQPISKETIMQPGMLIAVEGIGGAGKSTFTEWAVHLLNEWGVPCLYTREPGGTKGAEVLRQYCRNGIPGESSPLEPMTVALLFNASRSENIGKVIKPALEEGKVVITDRFADSTFVHQHHVNGCDMASLVGIHQLAIGLYPELTFILDAPAEVADSRLSEQEKATDVFDRAAFTVKERLRKEYLMIAERYPERYVVLDATLPLGKLFDSALPHLEAIRERFKPTPKGCGGKCAYCKQVRDGTRPTDAGKGVSIKVPVLNEV